MSEPTLDFRQALRAVYRRRLLVVALAVAGVASGVVVTALRDAPFVARAQVLLPPAPRSPQGVPLRDPETEALVATNAEVLAQAAKSLGSPGGAALIRPRTSARAVSLDVVEIRTQAETATAAAVLAQAVAEAYAGYANSSQAAEADKKIAQLQQQAVTLEEQIRQHEARIAEASASLAGLDQTSAAALSTTTLVQSLRSEQAEFQQLLNAANSRLGDARLDAQLSRQGTRTLGLVAPPAPSGIPWPVLAGALGMLGALAGALLSIGLALADRRLRRRRDIAAAVGAPVLASLKVPRRREFTSLLRHWRPTRVERTALHHGLVQLGVRPVSRIWDDVDEDAPTEVLVVTVPGDRSAALVPLQLAIFAAGSGTPTALILDGETAGRIGAPTNPGDGLRPDLAGKLWLHVEDDDRAVTRGADLVVRIVVVEPGSFFPSSALERKVTVLAVSAGFATEEVLSATAVACDEALHPIRAVFVADPDSSDRTTGLITPTIQHPHEGAPGVRGVAVTGERSISPLGPRSRRA